VALFSFLDPVLNVLFGWLLNINPILAVLILSLVLSLLVTLIYKFTTNQSLMKTLKEEIKALQQEMKTLKNDPAKMMEVNKRAMETNMKYMSQSFRPMLFTFIPVIIIFGWLNAHLAFEPIHPGTPFDITVAFEKGALGNITAIPPDGMTVQGDATHVIQDGSTTFTFKALQPGTYPVTFEFNDKPYVKDVQVASERAYLAPELKVNDGAITSITTVHEKTKVLFGLSWLWSYIIFSLICSMVIRKVLKVY